MLTTVHDRYTAHSRFGHVASQRRLPQAAEFFGVAEAFWRQSLHCSQCRLFWRLRAKTTYYIFCLTFLEASVGGSSLWAIGRVRCQQIGSGRMEAGPYLESPPTQRFACIGKLTEQRLRSQKSRFRVTTHGGRFWANNFKNFVNSF